MKELRHFICFLFLLAVSLIQAQPVSKDWVYQMGKKTLEEKLKKDVNTILQDRKIPQEEREQHWPGNTQLEQRTENGGVSNTAETESEIHAAINPTDTNNIIVAAMKFEDNPLGFGLSFPIYYTNDFGQTWKLSNFDGVSGLNGFLAGGGDPILVFDSEGKAYLSWLALTLNLNFTFKIALYWAVSEDGGATWKQQAGSIDEGSVIDLTNPQSRFVDKEWIAVDRSDSEFNDNLYIAYAEIDLTDTTYNILVRRKKAKSATLDTLVVDVTPEDMIFAQFTSIDVDHEGTVHLLFMGGTEQDTAFGLYHVKSTDGGETFSDPVRISELTLPCFPPGSDAPCNLTGIDPERVYPCPHLRVDHTDGPNRGNLYAVWTANGRSVQDTEGVDIYYARSEDGGKTWSKATVLNDDNDPVTHQFFPSLTVNDKGWVVATWYDRREDPQNLNTQYYMTVSRDGGISFDPNFAVSSQASDFSRIGMANANFGVGEYTQVVATAHYAIPFWADGRTNDGNIEIFTARIALEDNAVTSVDQYGRLSDQFSVSGPSPNPVTDRLNLQVDAIENTRAAIRIFDAEGRQMAPAWNGNLTAGEHSIELTVGSLPAGAYFFSVETEFGFLSRGFVIDPK